MRRGPFGSVLLVGEHGGAVSALADRVRALGLRAVRAKTPDHALDHVEDPRFRFDAVLFSTRMAVADWAGAIDALRARGRGRPPAFVAVGPRAGDVSREELRRAGVEWALWEPVGAHTLRFQLNRILRRGTPEQLRGEERVPTEWRVRFWQRGRVKPAALYSLSPAGAFLATARPSQRGCEVAVELPLPEGRVTIAGEVVYTNVPGNLNRRGLPYGMALRFTAAEPDDLDCIRRSVERGSSELRV
jgi:CheY-like chemotaxis protein